MIRGFKGNCPKISDWTKIKVNTRLCVRSLNSSSYDDWEDWYYVGNFGSIGNDNLIATSEKRCPEYQGFMSFPNGKLGMFDKNEYEFFINPIADLETLKCGERIVLFTNNPFSLILKRFHGRIADANGDIINEDKIIVEENENELKIVDLKDYDILSEKILGQYMKYFYEEVFKNENFSS